MFDWMGDAWDSFTGLFGGSEAPSTDSYGGTLANLDIDGDGSIGSMPISSYDSGGDYDYLDSYGKFDGVSDFSSDYQVPGSTGGKSFTDSLTSAPVLGALITSGAGLIGGMNTLDQQKNALKAQQEQVKMNQMLELAKLKYQLLGKGAGGGRRAGGNSNRAADQDAQFSRGQSSGYNQLGANLASIYGG